MLIKCNLFTLLEGSHKSGIAIFFSLSSMLHHVMHIFQNANTEEEEISENIQFLQEFPLM